MYEFMKVQGMSMRELNERERERESKGGSLINGDAECE